MAGFSCVECLAAEAVAGSDEDGQYLCGACLKKKITDRLLDLVNDGDAQVHADGTFSGTAKGRAKARSREGI